MGKKEMTDEEWFEKVFVRAVEFTEDFYENRKKLGIVSTIGESEEESVKCNRRIVNYVRSLQVENKRLSDKAIALEVETNNQQAEIEWLKNETTYVQRVADAFKGDYKNAKADGVRELLQELIEMEIKLDPLRSGIRYKALIGYAEENGVEVDL